MASVLISVYSLLTMTTTAFAANSRPTFDKLPSVPYLSDKAAAKMFPTPDDLKQIYLSEKWKCLFELTSYEQLFQYTLCEGPRILKDATYSYYLCPEDPVHPLRSVCCMEQNTSERQCCRPADSSGGKPLVYHFLVDIAAGIGAFICVLVIFICFRKCRTKCKPKTAGTTRRPTPEATAYSASQTMPLVARDQEATSIAVVHQRVMDPPTYEQAVAPTAPNDNHINQTSGNAVPT